MPFTDAPVVPSTPTPELDALLARLTSRKDAWVNTGLADRAALLARIVDGVRPEAARWAGIMSSVKGISLSDPLHGESWMYGPAATVRCARLLREALEQGAQPRPPSLRARDDGQWIAQVFPATLVEHGLGPGWRVDLWVQPGKPPTQGGTYRDPPATGRVGLVLGAGNVSAIPATDVLHKLFVDNEVVLLKMHDVNAGVGPSLGRVFQPLVEAGFLAIAYGGADVGRYLTEHALVESVHITGSNTTHDVIVWGSTTEEQAANKRAGTPRLGKPITSELGGVSPVIVVPGDWSHEDLQFQAQSVAGMVTANAGFNCLAANCLVLSRRWKLRETFLAAVEDALRATPPRPAYYPGAMDRYEQFLRSTANPRVIGQKRPGCVPWTLARDVPPRRGEPALSREAFCGVLAETSLDADGPADFLAAAVGFCNGEMWGTLSCSLLIDDATRQSEAAAFEAAIAGLRYGGIAVNGSPMFLFGLMSPSWGAFPGHTLDDVVSGIGVVHNTFLFDHPEKSVHYYPFRIRPKPLWFADHRTLDAVGRTLTRLEAKPSVARLARAAVAAIRG